MSQQKTGPSIPFTRPWLSGREAAYVSRVLESGELGGDGRFCALCADYLEQSTGAACALITTSATHALELAALVSGLAPGQEVLMPSFTFPSTANAVVLRGAVPVFVDIREDTLNIDEELVASLAGPGTRALIPVHYGGVACAMDVLVETAQNQGMTLIEDAAHGLGASWRGQALGGIGACGVFSFQQTKNHVAGEAGALLINDPDLVERAEICWEKGTNRRRFGRGEVDRYTWQEVGSSYAAGEIVAAVLFAQLEAAGVINERRRLLWDRYHAGFAGLEQTGRIRRPVVPADCVHSAHIYYLLAEDRAQRDRLLHGLRDRGIGAVSHYEPLHTSPAGRRYGRMPAPLPVTERTAGRLLRLPLAAGMTANQCDTVMQAVEDLLA